MKDLTVFLQQTAGRKIWKACLFTSVLFNLVQTIAIAQMESSAVHLGLIYPISTHGASAREYSNIFSLHAIAGVSGEEHGAAISGFTNITGNSHGFLAAGFSNHIGGYADGATIAGFVNTYGSAKGAQIAGFANIARKNVSGVQIAGFTNISKERSGLQVAGFSNHATRVQGQQVAGFINTAGDVYGIQVAGFINRAKKVKGVQLAGFINIADSSDYPVGIINIIKDGEKRIGVSTDDNLTTLLAFRSGGRVLYGIIGIGHNLKNTHDVYSIQYGLGAHLIETHYFRLNTEAITTMLENFKKGSFTKYTLSLLPSLRIGNTFEIFGGPSLNFVNTDTSEGKGLVDNYIWDDISRQNHLRGVYVGYMAGIHVKI